MIPFLSAQVKKSIRPLGGDIARLRNFDPGITDFSRYRAIQGSITPESD
jgi:hypothetical protein